jgi:pimeloyl-ACP methyl ester carboxylesterase
VYLDLRDHGRSEWGDPADWSFELCADDVRAFCDALGIEKPIVFGHSLGGFVVLAYAARHPEHAGGLVLSGTHARFDLERIVEGFRAAGGDDDVLAVVRRVYGRQGAGSTDEEWARVFPLFGSWLPGADVAARTVANPAVNGPGLDLMLDFDVVDRLGGVPARALVVVGELDPITPVDAAREIADALPNARLEVIGGAGHFAWGDAPERFWPLVTDFVADVIPA